MVVQELEVSQALAEGDIGRLVVEEPSLVAKGTQMEGLQEEVDIQKLQEELQVVVELPLIYFYFIELNLQYRDSYLINQKNFIRVEAFSLLL